MIIIIIPKTVSPQLLYVVFGTFAVTFYFILSPRLVIIWDMLPPLSLSLSVWFLCYVITVLPTHIPVATATAEGVMGELVRIIFSCKHFMFPCKSVVTIVIITGRVVHGNGAH